MTLSGRAGVCYKPPTGQGFGDMQAEVMKLLDMEGDCKLRTAEDKFGYHWVVVENPDLETLVTEIHLINSSLSDSGWGPQLLCSVFGVAKLAADAAASDAGTAPGPITVLTSTGFLVYLFKRGTFYPFVPDGKEHRYMEAGAEAQEPGGQRPGHRSRPRSLVPALGTAGGLTLSPVHSARLLETGGHLIDVPGQVDVLLGDAARVVGHQRQGHPVVADIDIGMVVDRLGQGTHLVHVGQRTHEPVARHRLTAGRRPVPTPGRRGPTGRQPGHCH